MEHQTPEQFYRNEIAKHSSHQKKLQQKHRLLGWSRLVTITLLCLAIYFLWSASLTLLIISIAALLAVFLVLVSLALDAEQALRNTERLITICNQELLVLKGSYHQNHHGEEYLSRFNMPDNDLDLFGEASLFQYVNRANSFRGQHALASALISKTSRQVIEEKQQAVIELSQQVGWCNQLRSFSMIAPVSQKTEKLMLDWVQQEKGDFNAPLWKILRLLVPLVSFTVLVLYLSGYLTDSMFTTIMLLMLAFVYSFYKKISKQYSHLSAIIDELNAFLPTLDWIEKANFKSTLLQQIQNRLKLQGSTASAEIKKLKGILGRFDYRLNPVVHIPLSIFLFWDLQQVFALEKWRKAQTGNISGWFEATGNFEMSGSLATLRFNQPNWVFPVITDHWFELECRQAGHPLIKQPKLVSNDFSMQGNPQFALITGSNMAGKSTFLRTIGANMILAMSGAPVCANYMKVPVVKLISSMRITDNLEEETSTFYAELKKMKRIVEAANAGEQVFILIDEMLRGTNTLDRHTGSVALIRQLIKHGAVGIIASHDISLASLEKEFPGKLLNYHFDSTIIKEEIIFDYKLKPGVCESTNAYLLMKKIGIEMQG